MVVTAMGEEGAGAASHCSYPSPGDDIETMARTSHLLTERAAAASRPPAQTKHTGTEQHQRRRGCNGWRLRPSCHVSDGERRTGERRTKDVGAASICSCPSPGDDVATRARTTHLLDECAAEISQPAHKPNTLVPSSTSVKLPNRKLTQAKEAGEGPHPGPVTGRDRTDS